MAACMAGETDFNNQFDNKIGVLAKWISQACRPTKRECNTSKLIL